MGWKAFHKRAGTAGRSSLLGIQHSRSVKQACADWQILSTAHLACAACAVLAQLSPETTWVQPHLKHAVCIRAGVTILAGALESDSAKRQGRCEKQGKV